MPETTADNTSRPRRPVDTWNGHQIGPGESKDIRISIGESYSGVNLRLPLHVRRAVEDGPTVFVTAALHGDEINGAGAIRQLVQDEALQLKRGTLILVPVVNILGFERHSRYLPDRRDLNRCFPGSAEGSFAARMADHIFSEIVARSDYGIDLHTASVRRTNFPNIRADMNDDRVADLAEAFGCEIIINGKGPPGAFRREACAAGCPTIVLEAGEVWKVEPAIVEFALRGIKNVLINLDMLDGQPEKPPYHVIIEKTKWVRAEHGGFLQFYVSPGDIVRKGKAIAANTSLLGRQNDVLEAPFDAIVIGITTLPAVSTGEPVCHLARLPKGARRIEQIRRRLDEDSLHERLIDDLATNVWVVEPEAAEEPAEGDGEKRAPK